MHRSCVDILHLLNTVTDKRAILPARLAVLLASNGSKASDRCDFTNDHSCQKGWIVPPFGRGRRTQQPVLGRNGACCESHLNRSFIALLFCYFFVEHVRKRNVLTDQNRLIASVSGRNFWRLPPSNPGLDRRRIMPARCEKKKTTTKKTKMFCHQLQLPQ